MGVLGILTCQILELEFADLLGRDKEVSRITILENKLAERLIAALEPVKEECLQRIGNPDQFRPAGQHQLEVLVGVLELALHNRKKTLQQGLIEAARTFGPHVDALMLGYGLCGNALEKPAELFSDAGVPVFVPMDEDHPVDDCIGLIIGGRERYYRQQCHVAGTFFMIPGWTYHWKRMFEQEFGDLSPEMAKRLLFKHYERSLLISTPIMSLEEMKQNSKAFNELFGLRTEVCRGTLEILKTTWNAAKNYLRAVE